MTTTAASLYKDRGGVPLTDRRRFLQILQAAIGACGIADFGGIINVILLSKAKMARLNWESLRHEGPTDVITFDLRGQTLPPLDEGAAASSVTAEIYICPEVALEYAAAHGLSPSRELVLYAVHGMLHLSGQDDIQDIDRAEMRRREAVALDALTARGFSLEGFLTSHALD